MGSHSEAFFHSLPHSAPHSQRYCVWHTPNSAPKALVVYVHPFAEEMNKARRMAALQSRAFAQTQLAVLQLDLLGCGDSAGDFGDATWPHWVADVQAACDLARQLHARDWPNATCPPLWLWGLRAGSLLACAAAQDIVGPVNLLLWQPSLTGKSVLQQFLRLKVAAAMGQADTKGMAAQMRAELAANRHLEVAGYRLAPGLASGLDQAVLHAPAAPARVIWLETSARQEPALLPASGAMVATWQAAGLQVQEQAVTGPAFWSTVEIEDAPALIAATIQLFHGAVAR